MPFEQRPDTGAIFVNDRKTEDTHPDSTGTALIGGVEYWVSCWRREAKSGKKYLALSFKRKVADAAQPKNATAKPVSGGSVPFDDTIPFAPEVR